MIDFVLIKKNIKFLFLLEEERVEVLETHPPPAGGTVLPSEKTLPETSLTEDMAADGRDQTTP